MNVARITITPNDQQIIVGEVLPAFTFTYSGFVNGEDASVFDATPIVGSPTADANTVGTYPIIVTQDAIAGNYVFTNGEGTLTVSGPLSVEEEKIVIYPNPTSDKVIIDGVEIRQLELLDPSGKVIQTKTNANELNMTLLDAGVYYLRIRRMNNKRIIIRKLVKQ